MAENTLDKLLTKVIGPERRIRLREQMEVDPAPAEQAGSDVTASVLAQALNLMLFEDLIQRVPECRQYVEDKRARGERVMLDHGALRTVALEGMGLPAGQRAFARILEPLGYELAGTYPLEELKMCGFVYCHRDFPETISQFFVSEFYPEKFSRSFQEAVRAVVGDSRDPLSEHHIKLLQQLKQEGALELAQAAELLPALLGCFGRHHGPFPFDTYQLLKQESKEMAWIATEGNVFNHATDRVDNIEALADEQKALGRPMKPAIEVASNANIKQTAYRAATVERAFVGDGGEISFPVPGSFFEFIERGQVTDEDTGQPRMDLRFDSRNAQGIFKMTRTD